MSVFADLTPVPQREKLIKRINAEKAFNSISYKGVGLGSITAFMVKTSVVYTLDNGEQKSILKYWLSVLSKIKLVPATTAHHDFLFCHYSERSKDLNILEGARDIPGKKILRFTAADFAMSYSIADLFSWLYFLLFRSGKAYRDFKKLAFENGISKKDARILFHYFLSHVLFAGGCISKLKKINPAVVLFTYDRDRYSSIIAAAANSLKITTATIIHGSSFHLPAGYMPNIARHILIWGQQQADIFSNFGVNKHAMHIVGFPNMHGTIEYDSTVLKQKWGIPANRKVILLASQPDKQEREILEYMSGEVNELSDWIVVVKLHPTRSATEYADLANDEGNKLFFIPDATPPQESIAIADVVAGLNSTLLIEALSCGKPVLVVNPTGNTDEGIGRYMNAYGKAPKITKKGDLKSLLNNLEETNIDQVFNTGLQKKYFDVICAYREAEASEQIKNFLLNQQSINQ